MLYVEEMPILEGLTDQKMNRRIENHDTNLATVNRTDAKSDARAFKNALKWTMMRWPYVVGKKKLLRIVAVCLSVCVM